MNNVNESAHFRRAIRMFGTKMLGNQMAIFEHWFQNDNARFEFRSIFYLFVCKKKNEKKRSDSCETLFWHTRCVHMCIVDLNHMVVKQQNRLQNVKWHKIDLYRTSHFNSSWAYAAASNATSCLCTVLLLFIKFFFVRCCCFCAKLVIVILI